MSVVPEQVAAPSMADRMTLFGILTGGWLAQGCYALTKLGIPDLLVQGPRSAEDLATATDADGRAVRRVLRALTAAGLFLETAPGVFALTPISRLLCTDTVRSSHSAAIMFGEQVHDSFGEIMHTMRTGSPAFDKLHGKPFYDYLDKNPDIGAMFTAAMGAAPVPAALAGCDFTGVGTLVDVGGGDGGLLAKLLRQNPGVRGVLTELPEAIDGARTKLAEAGLTDRVDFAPGSFFDPLPSGADAYTLSRVLHNWDEDQASQILCRVREAIPDHGRLLIFERLESAAPPTGAGASPYAAQGQLIDLLMLLMLEGWDRTEGEYRTLLESAGFEVLAVRAGSLRSSRAESVIEAVPRVRKDHGDGASCRRPAPGREPGRRAAVRTQRR